MAPANKKTDWTRIGVGAAVVTLIGGFFLLAGLGDDDTDKRSTATTTRSAAPDPWKYMAGNGTYEVGNEKYWGIWEATAPRQCNWSIRDVDRYSGATILDEGSATPGQRIQVNIQPPRLGSGIPLCS